MTSDEDDRELAEWFERELVCPRDKSDLHRVEDELACQQDHRYPILYGIPIMLFLDDTATMPKAFASTLSGALPRTPESVVADLDGDPARHVGSGSRDVDPFVQQNITGICGPHFYKQLTGKLTGYPIPEKLNLPPAATPGQELLDVGCNWGRWSIAASRLGYSPIGIDPQLEAVLAAYRVAKRFGVTGRFLVGDARYLPFRTERFQVVHSYGVLQHFSKPNAKLAINEIGRVLVPGGSSLVQMTASYGPLALIRRARYAIGQQVAMRDQTGTGVSSKEPGDPGGFEVRHWSPAEIRTVFGSSIGPTELSVDAYFTINPHPGELRKSLSPYHQAVVWCSDRLQSLSHVLPPLLTTADSLFATSRKNDPVDATTAGPAR